ncbi:MAG: insulinase family protein [Verrucomicrobia bacterium]|nr:insulinase family protein [Verrucomicrobiota bacterium]
MMDILTLKKLSVAIALGITLMGSEAVTVSAAENAASPETQTTPIDSRIQEFTLDNGWKFIVLPRHEVPTVSFYTWADVGSAQEVKGITGIAHLLEHLAFKGTSHIGTTDYEKEKVALEKVDAAYQALINETRKGSKADMEQLEKLNRDFQAAQEDAGQYVVPNEFGMAIELFGGRGLNASTSSDRTDYFFSLPSNAAELWFFLESDRFYEPVFREFYKERNVVTEERRMRTESSPIGFALEELLSAAYKAHPYGEPTVGHFSDIQSLTPQNVMHFFRTQYVPASMTSVIVGDITLERAKELAKIYFERIPASPKPEPTRTVEPPQNVERKLIFHLQSQPTYIVAYHKPEMMHPDGAIYDAISSILSDGRSSRLYRSLVRDKQIAVAAEGFSGFPGEKYPNLFLFYAMPAPGHTNEEVAQAIQEEIQKLINEPVSEAELTGVKNRAEAGMLRALTSNSGWASALGQYQGMTGDWRNLFRQLDRIRAVTPADIQRVAKETFKDTNKTSAYIETLTTENQ